jgi:hypothetical protein
VAGFRGVGVREISLHIDEELERKLAITAHGYKTCIENYIVHVLTLDMDDVERYLESKKASKYLRD